MLQKYLISFLLADALFVATGALLVTVVFISKSAMNAPTTENVAPNLLLSHTPLNGKLPSCMASVQPGDSDSIY